MILNLSHPFEKGSVNHSINKDVYAGKSVELTYPTVDDLIKIIQEIKRKYPEEEVLIMKRDLKAAYRQMWMDPGDIHLLGYKIGKFYYFDVTLSMGSKSSALCCQKSTDMVMFIYRKNGYHGINYLDDLGSAERESLARQAFQRLGEILDKINITEAAQKAVAPTQEASFLGVGFNTVNGTIHITSERLQEIKKILKSWRNKKVATIRELQQLLGKLNFICNTVRAGRIFVSRLINSLKSFPNKGKHPLSKELRKDVEWWIRYVNTFDGVNFMADMQWKPPNTELACDACLGGCGGYRRGKYFHSRFLKWLCSKKHVSINELETMAIIIALKIWGEELKDKNLLVFCDNQATVEVINKGRARNNFAQACLREICWISAKNNLVIKVKHRLGVLNTVPDYLSRWHLKGYKEKFYAEMAGNAGKEETVLESMFCFDHTW